MTVKDLIAKARVSGQLTLPSAALKDLKTILASNDKLPNRLQRVTREQAREFLAEHHNLHMTGQTLDKKLTAALGRKWGGK